MSEFLATVAFYAPSLLYPIVSGPIAAYVLVLVLRRDHRRLLLLFWPLLVAVHVIGYIVMMHALGELFFGPGFIACLVTPIFAVGTALGLRVAARKIGALWQDPGRRAWLILGTILIPLLQVVTVVTLMLLAPSR